MSEILPPGRLLLTKLEQLTLFRPSVLGRRHDLSCYVLVATFAFVFWFSVLLWLVIGAIDPSWGLLIGNFFNLHESAGRIMSVLAAMIGSLCPYFQLRLLSMKNVDFLHEILAYDDLRNETVLKDDYRRRMEDLNRQVVSFLVTSVRISMVIFWLACFAMAVVTPLVMQGFTWFNLMFWSLWYIRLIGCGFYCSGDFIYVLGLWFLGKSHLDIQGDYVMQLLDHLSHPSAPVTDNEVFLIDLCYKKFVMRIKSFNQFSMDIVTPYRLVMTFACASMCFAAHQQSNVAFAVGMDAIMINMYVASLIFLSTACSFSNQRKKMYLVANRIFIKISCQRGSIKQMYILRRMIKSLGNRNLPSICLTDKCMREFEPMEFVNFVLDTFSSFILAAKLYWTHVAN